MTRVEDIKGAIRELMRYQTVEMSKALLGYIDAVEALERNRRYSFESCEKAAEALATICETLGLPDPDEKACEAGMKRMGFTPTENSDGK